MEKRKLSLQPSEAVVVRAAAQIYAAYISTGRVAEGQEKHWMKRSIQEAYWMAVTADDAIQSDTELS